ncbi:hypothetical protein DPMN_141112 [Dreissena polymorpha]|uniref:Uncharacterized protein n=1 Tax=Dreissena polymorpha TaxID=45954 RepID=A0A9D4JJL3_DREPO|nr:hypothetical protein DPMN_141112 [Dreissena polymorpha]
MSDMYRDIKSVKQNRSETFDARRWGRNNPSRSDYKDKQKDTRVNLTTQSKLVNYQASPAKGQ